MFTGLVEGQGTVRQIAALPVGLRFSVVPDDAGFSACDAAIGDSISISGCCLTVVAIERDSLDFEAGEETLSRTNLERLKVGSRVNLERSLAANARLGGHFVQGHVDGVAAVSRIVRNGDWTDMWLTPAVDQQRLLVPKGSVAIDGISLTVVNVTADQFSVALIPHTLQVTTLGSAEIGNLVNLENDILGKYVDQLLERRLSDVFSSLSAQTIASLRSQLNTESPPPQ
ncbi:MAG: riboflavin synthase [Planctomycetaceae bacterium]|nr:riboflavin synthase [Planctomycetaceae bacterium]